MKLKIAGVIVTMAALAIGPAKANPCELHIWPTAKLNGGTMGSGMPGLLPALMTGDTRAQVKVLGSVLDPAGQSQQLKSLDLESTLGLPAQTAIYFHDAPQDWKVGERNTASQASCYYELKVDEILFNRHPLYGKDILSFFTFRSFADGQHIAFRISSRVRTKMPDFPKKVEADADSIAAVSAMVNRAFVTDFTIFAKSVRGKLRTAA